MNENMTELLRKSDDPAERGKVLEIGKLTGLKSGASGLYGSNFERGLLLRRLLRVKRPARILELGAGRGFGSICMASCALEEGISTRIETVDFIPSDRPQLWPHEKGGKVVIESRALGEFWKTEFPTLAGAIKFHHGDTTTVLSGLLANGDKYDLIFIDAGHDLRSVFMDLAASIALLNPGGTILMDDFAPMEPFGLATCISVRHAMPYFGKTEIVATEGLCFPSGVPAHSRRSMVLLGERNSAAAGFHPGAIRILLLRIAGKVLDWLYSPDSFRF